MPSILHYNLYKTHHSSCKIFNYIGMHNYKQYIIHFPFYPIKFMSHSFHALNSLFALITMSHIVILKVLGISLCFYRFKNTSVYSDWKVNTFIYKVYKNFK